MAARILVVEDDETTVQLFQDVLGDEGFEVIAPANSVVTIETIAAVAPDLIILDHMMEPDASGWSLAQKIKQAPALETIPLIVCTAALVKVGELKDELAALGIGVVLKPFDIDTLINTVQKAIRVSA